MKQSLLHKGKTTKLTRTKPVLGELDRYDIDGMPKSDILALENVYRCPACGTIDQYETCECRSEM